MPDSGTVDEHWKERTDSDVCQAMKDLSRWQTSLEKLSTAFREYEKLSTQLGGDPDFESNSEDFENVRIEVREVTIAVKGRVQPKRIVLSKPSISFTQMDVCNENSKQYFIFEPEHFQEEKTHPRNSNSTSEEQ